MNSDFPRLALLSSNDAKALLSSTPNEVSSLLSSLACGFTRLILGENESVRALGDLTDCFELQAPVETKCRSPAEYLAELFDLWPHLLKRTFSTALEAKGLELPASKLISELPLHTCSLLVRLRFTSQTEAALRSGDVKVFEQLATATRLEVQQMTAALRADVTKNNRKKMIALLCILIDQQHFAQDLATCLATDSYLGLWQRFNRRLRYYLKDGELRIRCGDVDLEYGFRTGASTELVKTPLTHTVNHATMQTLGNSQNKIIAPNGPAGTGKTETQRDLARALGLCTVVFNCADGMTIEEWSDRFRAMSSNCDLVLILDEFNRLPAELMRIIVRDLKAKKCGYSALTFNPGSAGGPIPEDLKPQMVMVEMTRPDVGEIAEVMFASEGFSTHSVQGRTLADRLAWCAETFSKQHFYDFGLRTLKSVVKVAGAILRASEHDTDESDCLDGALALVIGSRLVDADLSMFQAEFKAIADMHASLMARLSPDEQKAVRGLSGDNATVKMAQLLGTTRYRHGLAIIAHDRNTAHSILSSTAAALGVKLCTIDVKSSATAAQLYGELQQDGAWTDGSFSRAFRAACAHHGDQWILLNGDCFTAALMDPLNTLLDDNKVLVLGNNERLSLPPCVRIIILSSNMNEMSPANVSRLGVVHLNTQVASMCSIS